MRKRGLRWLHRHGHLDDVAVHTLDNANHAGGWSVEGSVVIPGWDRQGLERLVRYCARPPLSGERLVRIYQCLPLLCPSCGQPLRIIAVLENPPPMGR